MTDKENANTLANMSKDVQTLSDFSSLVEMPKVPREKANMTIGSHSSIDINFLEGNYPEAGLSTGFSF